MTAEIEAKQSVSGLRSECLPFGEVLAQSVANIAPTATPTINLALVFASAGNATWLAYVIATIGLVFVGLNINQFARRSASPGSLYSFRTGAQSLPSLLALDSVAAPLSSYSMLVFPTITEEVFVVPNIYSARKPYPHGS